MSILIKGMEIPESCLDCKVHYVWGSGRPQCLITGEFIDDCNAYEQKRLEDCPLIPVQPHGRLIDADALEAHGDCLSKLHIDYEAPNGKMVWRECVPFDDIPTIIPAEEGE